MGFFNKILEKLGLRKGDDEADKPATAGRPTAAPGTAKQPTPPGAARAGAKPASTSAQRPTVTKTTAQQGQAAMKSAPVAISEVDVVKKLELLGAGKGLNWKVSIVDLLTLLDIDSSREARKELAEELGCPPEMMSDSARMNTWLHKAVLKKIAENGGNIPQSLLD